MIRLMSFHPNRLRDWTATSYTVAGIRPRNVYPIVWIGPGKGFTWVCFLSIHCIYSPSDNSAGIISSFHSTGWFRFNGVMFPDGTCRNFSLYSMIGDMLSVCQIKLWVMYVETTGDFLNADCIGRPVNSMVTEFIPITFSARQSYSPKSVSRIFLMNKMCFVWNSYSELVLLPSNAWSCREILLSCKTGSPCRNQWTLTCGCDTTWHSNCALIPSLVCTNVVIALTSGGTGRKENMKSLDENPPVTF